MLIKVPQDMNLEELKSYREAVLALSKEDSIKELAEEKLKDAKENLAYLKKQRNTSIQEISEMDDSEESRMLLDVVNNLYHGFTQHSFSEFPTIKTTHDGYIKLAEREVRKWELLTGRVKPAKGLFNVEEVKQVPITDLYAFDKMIQNMNMTMVCCPFHVEKTPSMSIYHADNHYHCFGCGEHGDNITFVKKIFNLTFKEACQHICNSPLS